MRRRSRPGREDGMVTAETAVVLPVLLFVLAGAVAAVVVVAGQLRCVDAAREGARAAARGEPAAVVQRVAGAAAPDGAAVGQGGSGDTVTVTVAAVVAPLGPVPWRVTVTATATAVLEPAAGGGGP
ncbi:TadE family type IV pilus minor pilin [Modestobacter sp. SYSU DS0875]